ncbi:MAG: hypothetical protein JSS63_06545 [Bacteroidetes bacterium]|nr:hypothetical protein [Bacteroidota bacterium]
MAAIKILVVLFSLVNAGQLVLMSTGGAEKSRLTRILEMMNLNALNVFPGLTVSIIVFVLAIFTFFAFLKHYITYKEHYSSLLSFLIVANILLSFAIVGFNFFFYFFGG